MNTWKRLSAVLAVLLMSGTIRLTSADVVFPPLPADKPDAEWWKEVQAMEDKELLARFYQRVDTLIAKVPADDSIILDHFRSIRALVVVQMALMDPPENGHRWPRDKWAQTFIRRFLFTYTIPGDSDDSKAIFFPRDQGRWFHAYTSRHDDQMSYCWVFAPRGYWEKHQREKNRTTKYPLVVDLHGSCGVHGPVWASWHMSDNPPSRADQANRDNFTLSVWGRADYRTMADTDLWQELDWVNATFPIDPDRRCITGHSLGGAAAWRFATRSPGYWAAVVSNHGTWGDEFKLPWLQENIKDIPVLFWAGERDSSGPDHAYPVYKAMKAINANVKLILNPEQGHDGSKIDKENIYRWMLSQKRERPKEFSFVADSPWYPGRTGIRMYWEPIMSARPRFTCRIQGQKVHIDSEGTPGLWVDLGPDGLGMQGEVTIFWNGKQEAMKKMVPPEEMKGKDTESNVVKLGLACTACFDGGTVWAWPFGSGKKVR